MGRAEKIDLDKIKKYAKGEGFIKRKKKKKPSLKIEFPFDVSTNYDKRNFSAILQAKNIRQGRIAGYYVYISKEKEEFPDRINYKTKTITVEDLADGERVSL